MRSSLLTAQVFVRELALQRDQIAAATLERFRCADFLCGMLTPRPATTSRPKSCPTSASHCTVRRRHSSPADLAALIRLTPKAYGCEEERYTVPIEAVDTTRPKPSKHSTPLPSGAQSPVSVSGAARTATPVNPLAPRDWSAAIVRRSKAMHSR